MTRLAPLLAVLLTILLALPTVAGSATDAYADALDLMHGSRAVTKAAADDVDIAAETRALVAYATQQLNLAKAELRQLEAAYRLAMRELEGDAHECERERLTAIFAAERTRLKSRIREYRSIRGDRRGFFTKAWHGIGPVARRIVRSIGDGALDIVTSGGSLGGAARRLLIRAGRNEFQGAALRAIVRSAQGRSAVAVAAASSACGDDETAVIDDGTPAIPPGTYVGEWPMDLAPDVLVSGKVAEANYVELDVAEDGELSGEARYRLTGVFDGCPGYVEDWGFTVHDGVRVGSELPQSVGISHDALIIVPVVGVDEDIEYICGTSVEPFIDESGSAEAQLDVDEVGALGLTVGDDFIELHWVP